MLASELNVTTKFSCVATKFLPSTLRYVLTFNFYVATLFQHVFIDFSLHLLRQSFPCHDKVFLSFALLCIATEFKNVVTNFSCHLLDLCRDIIN